jgi:hypothetical protein
MTRDHLVIVLLRQLRGLWALLLIINEEMVVFLDALALLSQRLEMIIAVWIQKALSTLAWSIQSIKLALMSCVKLRRDNPQMDIAGVALHEGGLVEGFLAWGERVLMLNQRAPACALD